ncbi:MAG: 16S rRNA (cytosine(967)-C(5))-methyltransferase RsmB [Gammaproteobacteria bacterium]|nr:16S rRNA (cytosine(967)-C(5))-methyltransferase RsmB [Gammaproteobacteria bacterium]NIM75020.1 16S rRNA (cytosine(967)-C(5))-methyltransferase RsmB [Gammaproteobacteria bacterium]NIN40070.1 16S rRNA (cytosine(967)-C(5))-methyltransferase RsmB [Gammaproteobacteria bacterium]NIO26557.1 16S rRNA (cytosine(967)-C(5))-methyltransferase RsmB [Gammaproteobacteria bacterium]NIO67109.1 16S rRNA (cytosine(967)-C(5))-methyltransferase RsmB [Gammaproteobacteria bacterium]
MPNHARSTRPLGNPRAVASAVLTDLLDRGRSLNPALEAHGGALADARDRALARELCYGVARWLPRLELCLQRLMDKPLRKRESRVRAVLLLGLYQLMYTRIAEHAAVAESVALVRGAGRDWAAGLVNGVLRSFQRQRAQLIHDLDACEQGRYAHPLWLIDATREAWPGDWQRILESNNERPPMALRVNTRRTTRDAFLAELAHQGIEASPIAHTPHGLRLHSPRDVAALPGFAQGRVSVQDGGAQLAGPLLDVGAGMRVLDACAAPGGKSTALLESQPELDELVAVDSDGERLARLRQNLTRLSLQATVVCGDAGDPGQWWDGRAFDRILADVPCTGSGVIRRHPEIKLQRRPEDVETLAAGQLRLLDRLWPLVARRGRLLYATCSYLPRENDHVLAEFLAKHPDAAGVPISRAWGRATDHGRQVLPGEDTMDGFYYALLGKR